MRSSAFLLAVSLAACGGGLHGATYRAEGTTYHLGALPDWDRIDLHDNDVAWASRAGHVIATNATCEDHGDPSLQVLTGHLMMGFAATERRESEELSLDGRGALRTRWVASLDGVPVELELTVVKKDGCVYDLTYSAPAGHFDDELAVYRELVRGFRADPREP